MLIWFNSQNIEDIAHTLPKQPCEVGCNYFYKIRPVEHIVSFDPYTRDLISQDIANTKISYVPKNTFWTKIKKKKEMWREVSYPLRLQPQDSGTLAVIMAIRYLSAKEIKIVGCDWHRHATSSLFDHLYTHNKRFEKGSNAKLSLLREYQRTFNVKITFVGTEPVDKSFCFEHLEDLKQQHS